MRPWFAMSGSLGTLRHEKESVAKIFLKYLFTRTYREREAKYFLFPKFCQNIFSGRALVIFPGCRLTTARTKLSLRPTEPDWPWLWQSSWTHRGMRTVRTSWGWPTSQLIRTISPHPRAEEEATGPGPTPRPGMEEEEEGRYWGVGECPEHSPNHSQTGRQTSRISLSLKLQ